MLSDVDRRTRENPVRLTQVGPIRRFVASVTRTLSFYSKWLAEVIREPALMLSLVLGPFLILLLFGAGTKVGNVPQPRTIVVTSQEQAAQDSITLLPKDVSDYLQVVGVTSNLDEATEALARGRIDMVAVLPPNPEQTVAQGQQAKVRIITNEIDPLRDSYARAYLYYQLSTLNRSTIQRAIEQAQTSATELREQTDAARQAIDRLQAVRGDVNQARQELRQLDATLEPLQQRLSQLEAATAGLEGAWLPGLQVPAQEIREARQAVDELEQTVDEYDARLGTGGPLPTRSELDRASELINRLDTVVARVTAIPAEVLSAPFDLEVNNIAPFALSPIFYYGPAVLALLLQHLAVTLGALSMARVRLLGLMELLQTSPVRPIEIVIGNYLSYATLCIMAGAALALLLVGLLGVPLLGAPALVAVTLLLVILASLGVGFVISMISSSEQQAAQIAMLVLIASVFFSGFMIFLESIEWPVRAVSYLLPATYGIRTLRDLMLRGLLLSPIDLYILGAASIAFFATTLLLFRREFKAR